MVEDPAKLAADLSTGEEYVIRAMVGEGIGIGATNADSIETTVQTVPPRYWKDCEQAVPNLVQKGLLKTFEDEWFSFTPLGRKVAEHVSRAVEKKRQPDAPLPFEIEAPLDRDWHAEPRFTQNVSFLERDKSLAKVLRTAMEKVLRHPERAGRTKNFGRYANLFKRPVKNNYRLLWDLEGSEVVFVAFIRKDDPHYVE